MHGEGSTETKRLYTLAEVVESLTLRASLQDQIDELKRQLTLLSSEIAEFKTLRQHPIAAGPKAILSKKEAAAALSLSASTIDVLISQGMLRVRRQGRRVLVPIAEIERFAKRELAHLWPAKQDGKTTRQLSRRNENAE
jgi:excisionase family DNA binding protein